MVRIFANNFIVQALKITYDSCDTAKRAGY